MPKNCGLSAMTTTAFCTVERVTSAGRFMSWVESSCRVHEIPNSDVAGVVSVAGRSNVKYEKSSSELWSLLAPCLQVAFCHGKARSITHACAPSLKAINGSNDQPKSTAGSLPSSAPNHVSTSGPLAWWKPTTVTRGVNPGFPGAGDEGMMGDRMGLKSSGDSSALSAGMGSSKLIASRGGGLAA